MTKVKCTTCESEILPRYASLEGWLMKPKTNNPDELFVICAKCLSLGSATLDVMDSAPFSKLEREARREKEDGDNQRIRDATRL